MHYIDANKKEYGIEPICQVLEVAPSTYYERLSRPISARRLNDARLKKEIERVHRENFEVYGMEKMWLQLNKDKIAVGRDQVRRLMREMGLDGVVRGKKTFTTVPGDLARRPADLVNREFKAPAPNRLWVADLSYVWTRAGFVYVAFVTDVFSRFIVGWRVSTSLHSELALDALEMALWNRRHQELGGLVHHSDRGVQGEINRSSQHQTRNEELRWEHRNECGRFAQCVDRCGRRVGLRLQGVRIVCVSGRQSRAVNPARLRLLEQACHRQSVRGGFVKLAGCRQFPLRPCQDGISHSVNAKTSRSCTPSRSAFARSRVESDVHPRRSRENCVATLRLAAATWNIAPPPRSGTPSAEPAARKWRSWQQTTSFVRMCKTASPARLPDLMVGQYQARQFGG